VWSFALDAACQLFYNLIAARLVQVESKAMSRVSEIIQWVQGPDVLDVGCAGHDLDPHDPLWLHGQIRARFPEAWGIDISSEDVRRLQQMGYSNVEVADAQSFSLGKRFDTVVAGEVIEHLGNPSGLFASAIDHLKPGGRLIVTTPFPFGLMHYLYAMFRFPQTCSNPQHVGWFCPTTLEELTRRMGLKVEHWKLIEDWPAAPPSLWYQILRKVTRALKWLIPRRFSATTMLFVLSTSPSRH
jgi:cyclopropane fatty-acyl-phospholipid synthase-like methyltransferase